MLDYANNTAKQMYDKTNIFPNFHFEPSSFFIYTKAYLPPK
jgi:hypothetical protein